MLSLLVSSNLHHGWIHAYFCVFLCIINAHGRPDNTACTCDLENICMWILPSNWTRSRERDMGGRSSAPAASVCMQSTRLKEHLYYCLLKAAETLSYIIQRHHYWYKTLLGRRDTWAGQDGRWLLVACCFQFFYLCNLCSLKLLVTVFSLLSIGPCGSFCCCVRMQCIFTEGHSQS